MFHKIKGQDTALHILNTALEHDRVAQAYLFHGIDGVGKFTAALYFGMALNCLAKSKFRPCGVCSSCHKFLALDHPDLIYIFPSSNLELTPDGEIKNSEAEKEYEAFIRNKVETPWQDYLFKSKVMIRRESINWLIKRLSLSAYEANYRICIVEDAGLMNTETANAFLKTLEEPPQDTVIILLTENLSSLLPTIVSRCQPIYFQPVAPTVIEGILTENFGIPTEKARTASRIADGSVKRAIFLAQVESSELRDRAFEIFRLAAGDKELAFFNTLQGQTTKLTGEAALETLRYVGLFAGDLNLAQTAPEQIVNVDKKDFLLETRAALPPEKEENLADAVLDLLLRIEDLSRKVRGNVNLQLVMLNLYLGLGRIFRG